MAKDNTEIVTQSKAIKKTGRGGKYNFPNAIDPDTEDKETISAVLSETLRCWNMGDDRPNTDDDIYTRSQEYIQSCIDRGQRPTVENYCLALGYPRQTVHRWKNGENCSAIRSDIIKKAFDCFAAFDAGMASAGKLNAVLYFFRAKNYYDMRDQQELVIQPKAGITDENAVNIAEKYAELPGD